MNYELAPNRTEPPERRDTTYLRHIHSADNLMMYRQERQLGCLWPTMNVITGFSWRCRMQTWGSRSMWMKNIGISMVNKNGQDRRHWGSADATKPTTTDWVDYLWDFSPDDRVAMRDYYFEGLWFRLSTEGGSATNVDSVWRGGNFKLKYFAGYEGDDRRWVVGKYVTRLYMNNEIIQERPDEAV